MRTDPLMGKCEHAVSKAALSVKWLGLNVAGASLKCTLLGMRVSQTVFTQTVFTKILLTHSCTDESRLPNSWLNINNPISWGSEMKPASVRQVKILLLTALESSRKPLVGLSQGGAY